MVPLLERVANLAISLFVNDRYNNSYERYIPLASASTSAHTREVSETSDSLLEAASTLFAKRGYEGASVRAICEAAGTNVNAVSYHFGGKKALYNAVLQRLTGEQTASAQRILGKPPKDLADFESRLLLFTEEWLSTYIKDPNLLIISFGEMQQGFRNCDGDSTMQAMQGQSRVIGEFLEAARRKRILRKGVDAAIVAGALMERIANQVLYAETIEGIYGESIKSESYLRHWSQQTIDLLLYGAARQPAATS